AAESSLVRAATLSEAAGDDLLAAQAWIRLFSVSRVRARYEEADRRAEQARAKLSRLGDPPATLGFWESNVGTLAQARGDLSGARQHMERALELLEPLGSHRPRIISVLSALVSIYHDLGERTRAKAVAERAASLAESVYGADHPEFAETLKSLA